MYCMARTIFAEGEIYHVYNRGTDKREIFSDVSDQERFLQSMKEFNVEDPIGSLYEHHFSLGSRTSKSDKKLVDIIVYCLNPNHFHFLLRQNLPRGIEKFMQRLGTGYTKYFNNKYDRSGVLFQGRFKALHVDTNEYLLHLSAYINLNYEVHGLGSSTSKSSWDEYMGKMNRKMCENQTVLGQFRNTTDYKTFAENSVLGTQERRSREKEWASLLFE